MTKAYLPYIFAIALLLAAATQAQAANHYIRAGAPVGGDGSDWGRAWTDLPATFVRGDTYYVADGTYGNHTFNTAESGTSIIFIKKAIASDHGTETGWSPEFGDGQALFAGPPQNTYFFFITTGYWDFNGQVRGADWKSAYGFKVSTSNVDIFRFYNYGRNIRNVSIRYFDIQGGGLVDGIKGPAVYSNTYEGRGNINLTVEYCYAHDVWPDTFVITGENNVIRYNFFDQGRATPAVHGQPIAAHRVNNSTVAYNVFRNPEGSAVYSHIGEVGLYHGIFFYRNFIYYTPDYNQPGNDGVAAIVQVLPHQDNPVIGEECIVSDIQVHHNTLYNVGWWPRVVHAFVLGANNDTDRLFYNNLYYYDSNVPPFDGLGVNRGSLLNKFTGGYNWFYNFTPIQFQPEQYICSSDCDIFVNANAEKPDFRLTEHTVPGKSDLGYPYNVDMLGNTGSDRGAYEYVLTEGDISADGTVTAYDAALALQLGRGELEAGRIGQAAVGV